MVSAAGFFCSVFLVRKKFGPRLQSLTCLNLPEIIELMIYKYDVGNSELHIELDAKKNRASLHMDSNPIGSFDTHSELAKGKKFTPTQEQNLFIKLINLSEGFTVMLNNKHVEQSAGHPKKLMKRTLNPILYGISIIALHFVYIIYDLFEKGEMESDTFTVKTMAYLAYFLVLLLSMTIAYFFARRGKWKGAAIAFATLLINLLFSVSLGLYYNTGFNLFMWFFYGGHAFVLLLIYSHYSVISYVKTYSKELRSSN